MAEKIDVESGNPYRDSSGHFGTSPNKALEDSFKALQGKKFVPRGEGADKAVKDKLPEAKSLLDKLRDANDSSGAKPKVTKEERAAGVEHFRELQEEIGVYFALDSRNGGLTEEQAKEVEALRMEQSEIMFKIGRPIKAEKIAPESETKSTLSPEVVVAASTDKYSNEEAYMAIDSAFNGTYYNADTAVDDVMNGKNKDITAQEFYNTFDNTREALRKQYGDTIPLYRAEGKQKDKATKNWATTEEFVKQFGNDIKQEDVPVEDVVAVNVINNGKYHEVIVGKPPVSDDKNVEYSQEQKDSVKSYVSGDYKEMNDYMRNDNLPALDEVSEVRKAASEKRRQKVIDESKTLADILSNSTLGADTDLYRAANIKGLKVGTVFTDKGFISTSTSTTAPSRMAKNGQILRIKGTSETNGIFPADVVDLDDDEAEFIIKPDTTFEVTNITEEEIKLDTGKMKKFKILEVTIK